MSERQQILYMQVRIMRRASEKWEKPIAVIAEIFARYHVFQYMEECFGIFHVEGDEAVLHDVEKYLTKKESGTGVAGIDE